MPAIDTVLARTFPGIKHRSLSQGDLIANLSGGINVPVREILKGQPRMRTYLGDVLFRVVPAAWNFKYYVFGKESMSLKNAERGPYGAIQASNARLDEVTGKLRRYTWASYYDDLDIGVADEAARLVGLPLNLQAKAARDAREIVMLAVEKARSVVALAAGSYSSGTLDLDDTLGAGSEWNDPTNGDSRTSIRSMAQRIAAANGLSEKDIEVVLSFAAYSAAQNDPVLLAKLAYTAGAVVPNEEILATYWGVRKVTVADAFYTTDGSTLTSMYGDVAFCRVARDLGAQYDTTEGALDSFCSFQWLSAGSTAGPLTPFYQNINSTWYFPFQHFEQAVQVNTSAAGIIRNCAA